MAADLDLDIWFRLGSWISKHACLVIICGYASSIVLTGFIFTHGKHPLRGGLGGGMHLDYLFGSLVTEREPIDHISPPCSHMRVAHLSLSCSHVRVIPCELIFPLVHTCVCPLVRLFISPLCYAHAHMCVC